jgi:outer membrane protein
LNSVLKQISVFTLTLLVILLFTNSAVGQNNNKLSDTENGGFLEINTGILALNSRYLDAPENAGVIADLRFSYYWRGFFLENRGHQGIGFPGIGYNFYNEDSWMLDIFITETHPSILWDYGIDIENGVLNEQDGLIGIRPRESDDRIALRATRFIDDTTALRFLIAPISDTKGIAEVSPYLAVWYGKTWQYQNINFHSIYSAQYYNTSTLQYYYGVTDEDVSEKFQPYKAHSGVSLSAEFGMTYPLSADWLFESSVKLTRLPDNIHNSPLVSGRFESQALISLTYVIF